MDFLYRSATPAYKGSHAQGAKPAGLLAGFGSATPAYKTAGARAHASAPARRWWQVLAVSPSYKTAAPCPVDHVAPGEPSPDGTDDDAGPAGGCDQPLQVVIL